MTWTDLRALSVLSPFRCTVPVLELIIGQNCSLVSAQFNKCWAGG